jgi:hypothetical protein
MFTIGADPEVLLARVSRTANLVSVEGLVGGTKDAPVPIPGLEAEFEHGTAMQEDNVMLEFNIAPQQNWQTAVQVVDNTMAYIRRGVLAQHNLNWHKAPSGEYDESQLQTGQAATFGCSPDYDAYENGKAMGVTPAALGNWRCAGGHIHLGYTNPADIPPFVIVQVLDMAIGLLEPMYELSQGIRRQFYGTAGRYRPKSYGVEYRTPSNNWLFDGELRNASLRGAHVVARMVDRGQESEIHKIFTEVPRREVAQAINREDTAAATELYHFVQGMVSEAGYEL